jgi:hypothetical protein
MGPIYRICLEEAQAIRDKRIANRTRARLARLARFMRGADRVRWRRQGHRVTWR